MSEHKMKIIAILLGAILLSGLFSCGRPVEGEKTGAPEELPVDDQSKALFDLAGKEGRPLIIHLGMGMCQDCIEAEEIINGFAATYKEKILTREINIAEEPKMAEAFQVNMIPTIVIIDSSGKESYRHVGRVDKIKLQRAIEKSL